MNIEIIPAIDLIGGECVRLTQGDYARKTAYFRDPLEAALQYEEAGLHRLHLVDLDGAKASRPMNLEVLRRIAERTSLSIQYGGGIKSTEALERVFEAGADRAICGSIAVRDPQAFTDWLQRFGPERMILGADTRDGRIAIHGWTEASALGVEELIEQFQGTGLTQVICTDIAKDGMLQGPTEALYTSLQSQFPQIDITVSGGISSWEDIQRLDALGLRSVIVGKALYEGRITLDQLKNEYADRA